MKRRRYFRWGAGVSCGLVVCVVVFSLVRSFMFYDGKCGGMFPSLAGPRPCSFWDYASLDLALYVLVGLWYWPIVLGVLLLFPLIGYLFDRRARSSAMAPR